MVPPNNSVPSLEQATVADAMHAEVISCPPEASAFSVARMMAGHHIHTVFVMHPAQDDSGEPYVWGIVSDLDLMQALGGDRNETAGSLAREPVVTVKPPMPLCDAAALMAKHRVSHLAVIDTQTRRPIGVLSTTDIADVFAAGEG